ncbi:MAG: AMP-binding protein, partial [Casimicrobiaceae bacterium]
MPTYLDEHRRSLADRDAFWRERAALIDWQTPFERVLDYSRPPFSRWFVGGRTNLCHNAIDRHLAERAGQAALVYISTETDLRRSYTYRELAAEVNRFASILQAQGVGRGDRVLIYMPMIPEAVFAMLATVRIGGIHSVVFGGFAAASLAKRIDDAQPKLLITADAGMRAGKPVRYKPLVDEALRLARHPPSGVIIVDRGIDGAMSCTPGRDVDYADLARRHAGATVPCAWLESSEPSYILYTSGTTGNPKGVQRDTGGHAVALTASMRDIFCVAPGEAMFTTSDIGWVVGHSY